MCQSGCKWYHEEIFYATASAVVLRRAVQDERVNLDHVFRSQGEATVLEQLVSCCTRDNHRKGDRTPEEAGMKLIHKPLPQNIHTRVSCFVDGMN